MPKLTIQDLKSIKERVKKDTALREDGAKVKITVQMGTCGIAAGAGKVMDALMEEMKNAKRDDIEVTISGCMGMCSREPNIIVEMLNQRPILYADMDANKMRQIFKRHILENEVQTQFALAEM
ncbi:MAG: (2Fe-2S) ferredoxin domain-containing protein [Deltaproteobacteria bacterium]|nr:(2Fe-2S) ferredoxin domain-containing protein [Deltaproteobacteria bacterium]